MMRFHELIEERNRERCIAVTRAPDHSLRYEFSDVQAPRKLPDFC